MRFWENEYNYKIIDDTVSEKELQEFLRENEICLDIVDNSTAWAAFAQYYGRKNGFNPIHSSSFAYIVSLFMTGMGISASTEAYIKEETLELNLVDYYNQLQSEDSSETEKVIKMFNHIFKVYSEDISEYEYSTERLSFKLTPSEMKKFQSLEGKNNKEKFKTLLNMI